MINQLAIVEDIRDSHDKLEDILSSFPLVEMHFVFRVACTFLCVHLILEMRQELLQSINRVALWNIVDVDCGLKDRRELRLIANPTNSSIDHISDLRAKNLRNLASILPEDVRDSLLPTCSIDTHVYFEVLMDHQVQEIPLLRGEISVRLGALVHDYIS